MKQFWAISFLFIFLSANTAFGELLKLPVLIQHYMEHEDLQGDISFFDFLKEHYNNPEAHPDIPNHHHDNLPLKTLSAHSTSVVSPIPIFNVVSTTFIESDQTTIPLYQEGNFINNYLSQIWQPPRFG
ncbi:MAG: hypothetical protein LCH44_04570 [Bacteroidetes bacterium]|nr:hypothetical protein [Bacteroidota bacterium]MCB0603858.1 hypothetical protein [Saprospiraceae bacterium]MCO5278440.1 hypothetical protein [Saprospiraceae bacterium]